MSCSRAILATVGQWSGFYLSQLHGAGAQLRAPPGIHHAALSTAKRPGRATDQQAYSAMCPSAPLRITTACQPYPWRRDTLLQPPSTTQCAGYENPGAAIGKTKCRERMCQYVSI